MAGWEQVLDQQMVLFKWWRSDDGIDFARGFCKSGGMGKDYVWLLQSAIATTFNADPFYIHPEMMDVIEAATETWTPEPLMPTDIITPCGFVVFPRPLFLRDVHGKKIAFRAAAWTPATSNPDPKATAPEWRHVESDNEYDEMSSAVDHATYGGRNGVMLFLYSHRDDDHLTDYGDDRKGEMPELSLLHHTPWWFDDAKSLNALRPDREAYRDTLRDLQVFFRLTMQYISVRDKYEPPRHARRRAERASFPKKNITVVRLRRPKQKPTGNEREVEWTHRWIVGGHWRLQPYPSLGIVRQIWISDYVKGPEDKELRLRKGRAFQLVQ